MHDYNWHELQVFRVQDRLHAKEALLDIAIPHMQELVVLLQQHPDVTVFVELKRVSLGHFGIQAVVEQVLPLLQLIKDQVVLISYSLEVLTYLREVSDFPLGAVIDEWAQRGQSAIPALKPEYLFCDYQTVPAAGELGYEDCKLVLFETIDPRQAYDLLQRGVNMVETFAIGEMLAALADLGAQLE